MRTNRAAYAWLAGGVCVLLAGCRFGMPSSSAADRTRRPGELAMRSPTEAASPASRGSLGGLEAVDVAARGEAAPESRESATSSVPPPLRVNESSGRRAVTLDGQALVLPGGLTLQRVPSGVRVRLRSEQTTGSDLWEVVDARERRLALVKLTSLRRVGVSPTVGILDETRSVQGVARTARWNGKQARIVTDRFQNDTHLYTIERRAEGTDWIRSGLELTAPR